MAFLASFRKPMRTLASGRYEANVPGYIGQWEAFYTAPPSPQSGD